MILQINVLLDLQAVLLHQSNSQVLLKGALYHWLVLVLCIILPYFDTKLTNVRKSIIEDISQAFNLYLPYLKTTFGNLHFILSQSQAHQVDGLVKQPHLALTR
ncbi:hypothetical protein T09_8938 [Trichinella sp. T9]|nr:hypothetical protein T09_8938 [Trichinella sp. T9]